MTESGHGPDHRDRSEIIWIGQSDFDPYRDRCADDFGILDFVDFYDALAEILTGLKTKVLVVNALVCGPELKDVIKTIISQGLCEEVCVYTTASKTNRYSPNGDVRVTVVENPEQLFNRLKTALRKGAEEIGTIADPSIVHWPATPPPIEQPKETTAVEKNKKEQIPIKPAEQPCETPVKEFQAAELTPEELAALLGPEFKTEE
ncbi:MAG: hypothetical protein WC975_00020 [Phycisphaerae bacterium]